MLSDTEVVVVLILGTAMIVAITALMIQRRRYKRDQELRKVVAGLMAEYREERKKKMECPNCYGGKTWRPSIVARGFPVDTDEPWMEDCEKCEGEGLIPKPLLNS